MRGEALDERGEQTPLGVNGKVGEIAVHAGDEPSGRHRAAGTELAVRVAEAAAAGRGELVDRSRL